MRRRPSHPCSGAAQTKRARSTSAPARLRALGSGTTGRLDSVRSQHSISSATSSSASASCLSPACLAPDLHAAHASHGWKQSRRLADARVSGARGRTHDVAEPARRGRASALGFACCCCRWDALAALPQALRRAKATRGRACLLLALAARAPAECHHGRSCRPRDESGRRNYGRASASEWGHILRSPHRRRAVESCTSCSMHAHAAAAMTRCHGPWCACSHGIGCCG